MLKRGRIFFSTTFFALVALTAFLTTSCKKEKKDSKKEAPKKVEEKKQALKAKEAKKAGFTLPKSYLASFSPLPKEFPSEKNPLTKEKIDLGRMLYYDPRLSKSGKISCNTCHDLAKFGVDHLPTSEGHNGQKGPRNAPTVYNAAGHIAQFWDGRSPDVEDQATKPILNPIEMAMPNEKAVVKFLKSVPGYVKAFKKAFPNEKNPVTFKNVGKAIGAFERKLVTPSRFDKFLQGDEKALTDEEKKGLKTFVDVGCLSCHNGALLGGTTFRKLGEVKPWPNLKDTGRFQVTKNKADKFMFKVPSLRNVAETGPYMHDGSIKSLEKVVEMMAEYQLGKKLTKEQVKLIVAFLKSLTGEIPKEFIAKPELPGMKKKKK